MSDVSCKLEGQQKKKKKNVKGDYGESQVSQLIYAPQSRKQRFFRSHYAQLVLVRLIWSRTHIRGLNAVTLMMIQPLPLFSTEWIALAIAIALALARVRIV